HSIEKLVIDAEAIASAQRLIEGIEPLTDSLAVAMFAQTGLQGDFLKLKETRALFRNEQHFPSSVIDRGLPDVDGKAPDILERARLRVDELVTSYERAPACCRTRAGNDCVRCAGGKESRSRRIAEDSGDRVRPGSAGHPLM